MIEPLVRGPLTCALCGSGMNYTEGHLDDGTRTTSFRCECGETYGCGIDRGCLDLGLVRADPPGARNDYAIFYENYERMLTKAEVVTDRLTGSGDR